jgi:hypothetical protein
MNRTKWRIPALVAGAAVLIVAIVAALGTFAKNPRERAAERAAKRAANPAAKLAYGQRRFAQDVAAVKRARGPTPAVTTAQRRRCDVPDTQTIALLDNARIYETHYREGEVNSSNPATNRVFACLYSTGTRTDLGINDVVEGNEFELAKGAGDLLAYSAGMWMGGDGSADCSFVVNLRTQKPVYGDSYCNMAESGDRVDDIALTAGGSFAFSRLTHGRSSYKHQIVGKSAQDTKARVIDGFADNGIDVVNLSMKAGSLEWLDSHGDIHTLPFP